MKGKVLESMRFGVPIVTTPFGVQGMADVADMLPVDTKPEEFARAVLILLKGNDVWRNQRRIQRDYIYRVFLSRQCVRFLLSDMGEFVDRRRSGMVNGEMQRASESISPQIPKVSRRIWIILWVNVARFP